MINEYKYKSHKWVDLENPKAEEISKIIDEFDIPIEAAEDLLSPTPKQRVVKYENCLYVVLHFPNLIPRTVDSSNADHRQEIDFIIGKNFLVTVHYDKVKSIDNFSDTLLEIKDESEEDNAGFIFHRLIKHLYHSLLNDVESIKNSLQLAENSVFIGEEKQMVIELSKIHRDILRFNNALVPHKEAINVLHGMVRDFLGEKYEYFVHDMASEYQRVDRRMQNNKDLLEELRHTNDSLLSAKQNEAMKGLTMMAFITFPLTLVAAIFSMDAKNMPIIGHPYDFWIIIWIMLCVMLSCLIFFAYKKWL
jgi:magnesium transporter